MARFKEAYSSFKASFSIPQKPSKIFTSAGSSNTVTRVSGFASSDWRESTGLMQKLLMDASSSSDTLPSIT